MNNFKQTDIGLIPEDWELKTLDDLTEKLKAGGTPKTTEESYWNGNIPLVKVEDVVNTNKYLSSTNLYITEDGLNNSSAYILPENSLLFTMYGTTGEVAINTIPVAPTQNVLGIIHNSEIDSNFLYYSLKFSKTGSLERIVDRTIFKHFTLSKVKRLLLLVPKLAEQKKIAYVLSKIQQAIEKQEQIIKTTQELKKALMQKLFTEGLYGEPQKHTEIGPIPESWEVVKLKDAVAYIDYGLSEAIPKDQNFEGVKNVSTADITREGKLLYSKVRKVKTSDRIIERLKLKNGDVLFNWRNSSELIGKTTIFWEQPETHIFASFILRIRCDEVKYHNYFLTYLMNYYREISVFIKLSRRAVNQANYNRNEIYVLDIPKPSYDEQVQIANTFRKADKKIELLTEQLNSKKQLFSNILNQLMTGQIRVKDIEFKLAG